VQSPSFYLSATGNDSTAVMNDPAKPFLTVQALMNKVALFGPTSAKPVKIYVGAGNFGNATMTTGFGSNVTWIGTSAATSIIGNLTFTAPSGAAGVAVGDPSVGDYDGKNGTNGRVVTIEADWNITFGNITANGGNGGLHAPDVATKKSHPGLPGGGGVLNLTGYFGTITAKGGNGHAGGAGGQVNLRAGSTSASIDMSGGDDLCTIATSCYTERDAGMGGNIGVLGGAIVTGNVTADGGKNNGKAPTYVNVAGRGGNIHIEGRVNGNVYARGGDSGESQVGEGGVYGDVAGAVVTGDVYLTTGASSSNGDFSAAGSAEIFGTVRDVIAYSHPVMGGMGGNVELRGIARNIHVEAAFVGCDNSSAGEVNVYFGGTATNVYAGGGDNACTDQTNGYVGVYGTVTGTVNVAGGNNINSTYSPGQSGDVRVYANGVVNFIVATGGNALATTCKVGGKGGLVELTAGATYNLANIDVSGGTGDTGCGSANGASGTINNI
jgi:hypothetical protein